MITAPDSNTALKADVVVVGAGLAGLTCAVGLVDNGLRVIVLEREKFLGGRAASQADEMTGDPVAIGPHILLNQYQNMFKLLERLGTRGRIVWQPDRRFLTLVQGQQQVVIRNSRLPPPYHFMPSLLSDPRMGFQDLLSNWPVVQFALELDEQGIQRLDKLNAREFLCSMGVSQSFIKCFWDFAALAIMNVPLESCSAAALMRFYQCIIGHRNPEIGFPDGGLGDLYAPQARRLIEDSGGQVITGAEVIGFLYNNRRVTGVKLTAGRRVEGRFCVAAVPPPTLQAIVPREWMGKPGIFADLACFEPVPYISVYLWFDQKLTRRQFWARMHSVDDLNCDFYDLSNINSGWQARSSVIASNIIRSQRVAGLTDREIVQGTVREIAEFLPRAARAGILHSLVNRIPMAIPAPYPGTERRRPGVRTHFEGLLLAGDWIQTRLPASMESAVASGWMAAEQILCELGRPQKLAVETPPLGALTWQGMNRFWTTWAKWSGMKRSLCRHSG